MHADFATRVLPVLSAVLLLTAPSNGGAQTTTPGPGDRGLGVGPRFTFVRGDETADAAAARYMGAVLRARLSPKTAIEVALDYRSHTNESLTERVRDLPLQGSLLLYPIRSSLAPYILGGIGWYSQRVQLLDDDTVLSSATTRTTGYHAGVGGEIRLGRRTAIHADYRYTFIHFGDETDRAPGAPGAIPLPGSIGLQEKLKLSHQGSMWTAGLAVFF